jgi:hypothetical protein
LFWQICAVKHLSLMRINRLHIKYPGKNETVFYGVKYNNTMEILIL